MKKPYILALDDDSAVLRAVERDLKGRFASRFRIIAADAPEKAMEYVRQITARGDRIALFLVDQRMPQMSGVDFLQMAVPLQPAARRVLLTAYADSNAAIDAINKVKLNHYLMKPWEPPDQNLFPVLTDLLEDWSAGYVPEFEGLFVIGTRWAPETHRVKDFFARNQVPYRWLEPAEVDEPRLRAALEPCVEWPAVMFPDGTLLQKPSNAELALKLKLQTSGTQDFSDVIIIGAGPAGLACALYCSTEGLKTVLVERDAPGGQAGLSSRIENYLGFPSGLSGADLARRGTTQVRRFGTEIISPAQAVKLRADGEYRVVTLESGQELRAHAVVLAAGVQWRRLDIAGIDKLTGAGVYYGASTTEAASTKGEEIYIVGGANSAGQAAVHFSEYASKVTMLVRGDSLSKSMSHYLVERIKEIPNIVVEGNTEVVGVDGDAQLSAITIRNTETNTTETKAARALFIFIGAEPHTEWLEGTLMRNANGFLCTGAGTVCDGKRPPGWTDNRDPYLLETSMPGVFAIGDVRDVAIRRVANSVGEGSIVLYFIRQYMRNR